MIALPELDEVIVEAWLSRAPKSLAQRYIDTRLTPREGEVAANFRKPPSQELDDGPPDSYWAALHAASACSFTAPAGIGEALMTSSHTSFAAARAPARSPSAALLQIASTFAFVLAPSVGASLITDLHSATASATAAELGAPGGSGARGARRGPGGWRSRARRRRAELLWLLVEEEELLLPHPAMNTLPTDHNHQPPGPLPNHFAPSIDRG